MNVVVKAVDTEKKRISLSLRDAEGDPWAEVLERFTVGQRVDGVLEKVLQARIPGARGQRHVTLERAGHFLQEDVGPELAQVVIELVAASPDAAAGLP